MQSLFVPDDSQSNIVDGNFAKPHATEQTNLINNPLATMGSFPRQQSLRSVDEPHTFGCTQALSRIHRMIDIERNHRSTTRDYLALEDMGNTFHNQVWRERVAQWCYDVLDFLEESRNVASVAMSIIDRYIAVLGKDLSPVPFVIREFDYEVISFTALFLAIRVAGFNKELEIQELLQLSSSTGTPQARHVVAAGKSMLERLSWNHQILTPNAFQTEFIMLLSVIYNEEVESDDELFQEEVSKLGDFATYLVEVSVCDFYFSSIPPSEVAFAALALSMIRNPDLKGNEHRHRAWFSRFFETIRRHTSMNIESPHIHSIISRLLNVYNQSQEAASQHLPDNGPIQLDECGTNGHVLATQPHIITDDGQTLGNDAIDSDLSTTSAANLEADEVCILLRNIESRNETTEKRTRPVSPLPRSPP